jgi:DNA-binding transcriptional LysR family regulator
MIHIQLLTRSASHTRRPSFVCRSELASGALERVLPTWRAAHATLTMLTPSRRGTLPSVRAFAEFLLKELPLVMS